MKNRWLPATMKERTVLGEYSSGLTGLGLAGGRGHAGGRPDRLPGPVPNDPTYMPNEGEHLFVWDAGAGPRAEGQLQQRLLPDHRLWRRWKAETAATGGSTSPRTPRSSRGSRTRCPRTGGVGQRGVPVLPAGLGLRRRATPSGPGAKVVWEYAIDVNGDGYITDADKLDAGDASPWYHATHAHGDPDDRRPLYSDAGEEDLVSAATGNEVDGIPYGSKHYFVWDSVRDIGCPAKPRDDVFLRVTPYDYPTYGDADVQTGPSASTAHEEGLHAGEGPGAACTSRTGGPSRPARAALGLPVQQRGHRRAAGLHVPAAGGPTTISTSTIKVFRTAGRAHRSRGLPGGRHGEGGDLLAAGGRAAAADRHPVGEHRLHGARAGLRLHERHQQPDDREAARRDTNDTNAWNILLPGGATKAFRTGAGAVSDGVAPRAGTLTYYYGTGAVHVAVQRTAAVVRDRGERPGLCGRRSPA